MGLGYGLDSLLFSEEDETKRARLRSLRLDINLLIEKVRKEIFELRIPSDTEQPLSQAISLQEDLTKSFNEIIGNVLQHSQASHVLVSIQDNGIGGAYAKSSHFGLQGVIERMDSHGAHFDLQSDFTGTHIAITAPLIGK